MKHSLILYLIIGILGNIGVCIGQGNICRDTKNENIKNNITDWQEHIVYLKSNNSSKINAIFYPNFNYKIAVCPESNDLSIEINFLDQDGKIQYTNTDKKYIKEWNFSFRSIMTGVIELKLKNENQKKDEQVRLAISYQQTED